MQKRDDQFFLSLKYFPLLEREHILDSFLCSLFSYLKIKTCNMIYKAFSHNTKSANLNALLIYLFFIFPQFYPFSFTLLTVHSLGHISITFISYN